MNKYLFISDTESTINKTKVTNEVQLGKTSFVCYLQDQKLLKDSCIIKAHPAWVTVHKSWEPGAHCSLKAAQQSGELLNLF